MIPKKSNLEAPRKPRVARWPEDAGKVKNLEVGDVLVVDGALRAAPCVPGMVAGGGTGRAGEGGIEVTREGERLAPQRR